MKRATDQPSRRRSTKEQHLQQIPKHSSNNGPKASSHRRPRYSSILSSTRKRNATTPGFRIVLALVVIFWTFVVYWTVEKILLSGASKADSASQHNAQVVVFHDDNNDEDQVPCGPGTAIPLRYTLQDPPSFEVPMLHAVVTPLWIGGTNEAQQEETNQTLLEYQLTYLQARLQLLQTFCAPSLRNQTSQNFYWIVIVDETTLGHEEIRRDLVQLVQDHNAHQRQRQRSPPNKNLPPDNAYLILHRSTNTLNGDSPFRMPTGPKHIGWKDLANAFSKQSMTLVAGDTQQWQKALESLQEALLMESMLYVDSGLHYRGIEWMQKVAMAQHQTQQQQQQQKQVYDQPLALRGSQQPSTTVGPWFLCAAEHFEWHNPDIFSMKYTDYLDEGIKIGRVGRRRPTHGCPLTSLTKVSLATSQPVAASTLTTVSNGVSASQIVKSMPLCQNTPSAASCLLRVLFPMPLVVVGETVSSDNMELMTAQELSVMGLTQEINGPISFNASETNWESLREDFGVGRYNVWQASRYLYEHTAEILRGHPCADAALQNNNACPEGTGRSLNELLKYVKLKTHQQQQLFDAKSKLLAMKKARLQEAQVHAVEVGVALRQLKLFAHSQS